MLFLELAALSIVAIYVVYHALGQPEKAKFLSRIVLVSAASWMAEESCIRLYRFYGYSPKWSLFLADIPWLVIVIWPIIIHSAWDLASQLLPPGDRFLPLAAAAVVLTDALLIEPVAVSIGLWSWKEAGIFEVPVIGILAWACFAYLCFFLFAEGRRRNGSKGFDLLILVLPVVGTHLFVLTLWWGAFHWAKITVAPEFATGSAWALSLFMVYAIFRQRTGARVARKTLVLRLLGALLFFAWLALSAEDSKLLTAYAIAFAPPYLALMAQQYWVFSPLVSGKLPSIRSLKR
jgi:hypothetical protein